ncbi:Sugar phosphate isomerase/epimerase [Paenibacillus sp. UNC496MF]|uniref:sugar phosphate isomerase/epimerase family protein n=1 Tax=Paenibacillus sp. UNC496MF TaxID=1502753 RepID=UPI0008ED4D69|nr:TIM barrel protein [Paenibacillus sp. UNC496MF]SFJ41600.1 Sugar phosphate isomerase/epimerase [Paenibacillus sp. UNC496MF]
MSYLSLSTWSLHRNLGPLRWTQWDAEAGKHMFVENPQPELMKLVDLPAHLAKEGFGAVEIGHFHFPSTDDGYLAELRAAVERAGISLDTILLDYGDVSSADEVRRQADVAYAREWIDVAAKAGAKNIRVVAGESEPGDKAALARSIASLKELHAYGQSRNVRVITENFKPLASTSDNVLAIIGAFEGGLNVIDDFGNFKGETKYEQLAAILPHAVSIHAKAHYDENGLPDTEEYVRCLELLKTGGYDGAVSLIYDGPGDMWEGLSRIRRIVEPYL